METVMITIRELEISDENKIQESPKKVIFQREILNEKSSSDNKKINSLNCKLLNA